VIHPKTLLISRHFYSLESYVWRSIYNLKIDTISMYDIPLDRSFLKLWNGIRYVMSSTDRRLELKEKTSMAQNAWQAFVYANGLKENIYVSEYAQNSLVVWCTLLLELISLLGECKKIAGCSKQHHMPKYQEMTREGKNRWQTKSWWHYTVYNDLHLRLAATSSEDAR